MGVALKFLALLFLTCIAIAIVVVIFWCLWKWILDNYLTDQAKVRREIEEYNRIVEKENNAN